MPPVTSLPYADQALAINEILGHYGVDQVIAGVLSPECGTMPIKVARQEAGIVRGGMGAAIEGHRPAIRQAGTRDA